MKAPSVREQERLKTRNSIMDATEALMREEGYASVSSRRIAERAGLKSQLVHYHFGTMDDLFVEVFRRNSAAFFALHLQALASPDPLRQLWQLTRGGEDVALALEFVVASNHRRALRDEIKKSTEESKMMRDAVISKHFNNRPTTDVHFSATVVSFIVAAVSRALNAERMVGATGGHDEVEAFMDLFLSAFQKDDH